MEKSTEIEIIYTKIISLGSATKLTLGTNGSALEGRYHRQHKCDAD